MILVTIDPGLRGCGCAAWFRRNLIVAQYVEPPAPVEPLGELVVAVGVAVHEWVAHLPLPLDEGLELLVERPQTYRGRASEGDANDLIAVAMVVGAVGALARFRAGNLSTMTPSQWKGQAPKRVTEARARDKLNADERARVLLPRAQKLRHNVWDAVGIGLHQLQR